MFTSTAQNIKRSGVGGLLFFLSIAAVADAQISIENEVTGDGHWEVASATAGNSHDGYLDPQGALAERDVIFDYYTYVDVGANGGGQLLSNTTITQSATLSGTNQVTSTGYFNGINGRIDWTAVASIRAGDPVYSVRYNFSSAQPFGVVRLISYLDEDVDGVNDDQLVVVGTPGQPDFQLLTVDRTENVGVAQGAFYVDATGMSYVGWAANSYPNLRNQITGSPGASFSMSGSVNSSNLHATTDSRHPGRAVYGPADITTALAFDFNPSATFASVTVYLGGSATGAPVNNIPGEKLRSPAFTSYNTYLNQSQYLELISAGTRAVSVNVTIHNLKGQAIGQTSVVLQPSAEYDIDINQFLKSSCQSNVSVCSDYRDIDNNGLIDTYGLVRLDFDDQAADKILLGRISTYRVNANSSYDFAFARELQNPLTGTSYSGANTFDPQNKGYIVPNWVEVVNLDSAHSKSFMYNLYDSNGSRVFSSTFTVGAYGKFDVQGGHEILNASGAIAQNVYLVELIPADGTAAYLMNVARYSSNSPRGTLPSSYNYAFSLGGRVGANEPLLAPITNENRDAECALPTNWLEVVNTSASVVNGTVVFKNAANQVVATETKRFPPKGQFHFFASNYLAKGTLGVAEITANVPGSLIAQSLVYFRNCDTPTFTLQTGYVTPAVTRGRATVSGTVNSFIGIEPVVRLFRTVSESVNASVNVVPFAGSNNPTSDSYDLSNAAIFDRSLRSDGRLMFPQNAYGVATFRSSSAGQIAGQVLRIKRTSENGRNRLDFVMPTAIR